MSGKNGKIDPRHFKWRQCSSNWLVTTRQPGQPIGAQQKEAKEEPSAIRGRHKKSFNTQQSERA